jgi:hypothetical protein
MQLSVKGRVICCIFCEHEIGRKGERARSAGDRDDLVLQGLAEDLQHARAELGQLVEKEDAAVGQGDLAGAQPVPAADQAGVRDGVVWSTKGPAPTVWQKV